MEVRINNGKGLGFHFDINQMHENIVVESTLQDLFDNFDDIPLSEIQALVDKYRKQ